MSVLATVGAVDTAAITLKRWGWIGPLACPGGAEGCDKVLNSPWGTVLGQPLSLFGFLAYFSVLLMAVLPLVLRGEARTATAERSWWGLLIFSTGMAIFSLVLMGVMVFQIQAFCAFCVLSAVLSVALFVLTLIGGEWEDRGALLFRIVIVAVLVAISSLAWSASVGQPVSTMRRGDPPPVTTASTPATIALAEHLTKTGAVMYSAYWCPHCHDQKQLFGKEATSRLTIVECAEDGTNAQPELCASKGLKGFPTWEINGVLSSGTKKLEDLAALSKFQPKGAP
jgi:uncharacterized membrane protein/glutaredoxin